jgi:DNA-binding NarL/FixJ family response regulator
LSYAGLAVIRVAIIEDQREIREGLRALIGGTSGFEISGVWRSMEEALDRIREQPPDVVLLDIGLPKMSGIEGTQALRQIYPALPILVLTIHKENDQIFDAICAGASGYLLKTTPPARLLEDIQEVVAGGSPMSPEVARRVIEQFQTSPPASGVSHLSLTPHERRLLKLLVQGHSYKTAAEQTGVTVNTVSFHVRKIYQKLQVHSKSSAVAKALTDHLL